MLEHHSNRSFPDLWGISFCFVHRSILSRVGASSKPGAVQTVSDPAVDYVVMGDDLAALKTDFNEAIDQVRLLFIVGPT